MRPSTLAVLLLSPFGVAAQSRLVSKDGTCSGSKGYTCLGSTWGNCCSQYGGCGSSSVYCGTGCDSSFGTCDRLSTSPSRTTSAITPTGTQQVSNDARCGPSFGGKTCLGSKWGDCCSKNFYCGSTNDYCAANTCQKDFGKCNAGSSSVKSSSRDQPSTTSRASSSSTAIASSSPVVSTSIVSSSITPQPTTCVAAPGCEPFSGSPARGSCPDANNKCSSGYQLKCGLQPAQGSSAATANVVTQTYDEGVACAALCTGDATCVGFTYNQRISAARWFCTTYSQITLETNTFSGKTLLKVCPNA